MDYTSKKIYNLDPAKFLVDIWSSLSFKDKVINWMKYFKFYSNFNIKI